MLLALAMTSGVTINKLSIPDRAKLYEVIINGLAIARCSQSRSSFIVYGAQSSGGIN